MACAFASGVIDSMSSGEMYPFRSALVTSFASAAETVFVDHLHVPSSAVAAAQPYWSDEPPGIVVNFAVSDDWVQWATDAAAPSERANILNLAATLLDSTQVGYPQLMCKTSATTLKTLAYNLENPTEAGKLSGHRSTLASWS